MWAIFGEINFLAKKKTYFTITNKSGNLRDNTSAKINIVYNVYCRYIDHISMDMNFMGFQSVSTSQRDHKLLIKISKLSKAVKLEKVEFI